MCIFFFFFIGQVFYLHPFHALWRVWEDHHGRWSHWIFPQILSWCHTIIRSVSDFLTSTSLTLFPHLLYHLIILCYYFPIQPSHAIPGLFPSRQLHADMHSPWSVKLKSDSYVSFVPPSFNWSWSVCYGWQTESTKAWAPPTLRAFAHSPASFGPWGANN